MLRVMITKVDQEWSDHSTTENHCNLHLRTKGKEEKLNTIVSVCQIKRGKSFRIHIFLNT